MPDTPTTLPIWKTRDGCEIPIVDLNNEHLINIIKLIRTKYDVHITEIAFERCGQALHYAVTAPEGAALAAESYANEIISQHGKDDILGELFPIFKNLLSEVRRRKLTAKIYNRGEY